MKNVFSSVFHFSKNTCYKFKKTVFRLFENYKYYLTAKKLSKNRKDPVNSDVHLGGNVNLYYWKYDGNSELHENLGDYLSEVIVRYYAPKQKKDSGSATKTLYAIGSILGFRCQNATVWGSGFISDGKSLYYKSKLSSYDVRAVRGPKTRDLLLKMGKTCPEVYGDPAILLPLLYKPRTVEKKHGAALILHYLDIDRYPCPDNAEINVLNILTTDYENFIDQIVCSDLVISSSLHGIIIAETYGVPAVLLNDGQGIPFKYEDWYNSTGRYNIRYAHSIAEALTIAPMPLPELSDMQKRLSDAFPYDLWK